MKYHIKTATLSTLAKQNVISNQDVWTVEHKYYVKNGDSTKSAFAHHSLTSKQSINWADSRILENEEDYYRRLFLESYHINSRNDTMNKKESVLFPSIYRELFD